VRLRPSKDNKQFMYDYGQLVGMEAKRLRLQAEVEALPGVYVYQPGLPNQKAVPDEQFNATYAAWSELWRLAYDEWAKAQALLGSIAEKSLKIDKSVSTALSTYADSSREATALCLSAIEHMDAAQSGVTVDQLRASRSPGA
jgi:hypothetical protein